MTLLKIERKANGASYSITVSWKASDQEHEIMLDQHGPCKDVELGGTFTETITYHGSHTVTVTLPSNKRDFPDEFPYTQTFTAAQFSGDYETAVYNAIAWEQHITKAAGVIQVALQALWTDIGVVDFNDTDTSELVTT